MNRRSRCRLPTAIAALILVAHAVPAPAGGDRRPLAAAAAQSSGACSLVRAVTMPPRLPISIEP